MRADQIHQTEIKCIYIYYVICRRRRVVQPTGAAINERASRDWNYLEAIKLSAGFFFDDSRTRIWRFWFRRCDSVDMVTVTWRSAIFRNFMFSLGLILILDFRWAKAQSIAFTYRGMACKMAWRTQIIVMNINIIIIINMMLIENIQIVPSKWVNAR